MEIDENHNEKISIFNQFNPNELSICPNCNLIYSFQYDCQNNKPIINFNCEKNHKGKSY